MLCECVVEFYLFLGYVWGLGMWVCCCVLFYVVREFGLFYDFNVLCSLR